MNVPSDRRRIAVARFPSLIRDAARSFRRLTGLTVVTTLGSASPDARTHGLPSPPVHPLCAKVLRQLPSKGPCDAEWRKHLQTATKSRGCRVHTCPLGLRCAGVPILLGDELVGLAKLVSIPKISRQGFRFHIGLLEDLIARPCQDLYVIILKEEIESLRVSASQLRRVRRPAWPPGNDTNPLPDDSGRARTLISRVLDYLSEHYTDRELSLIHVSNAAGKNEKYLSHLFVQQVGERMRTYITALRVRRACELLLQTDRTIEEVARDSGFANLAQFRQSFRRTIGVTASEYRQIFTAGV